MARMTERRWAHRPMLLVIRIVKAVVPIRQAAVIAGSHMSKVFSPFMADRPLNMPKERSNFEAAN
jgi:hypothetical protein